MCTQKENIQSTLENLTPLMQALSKLPGNQFDEAIVTLATLTINTLIHRQGKLYIEGFFEAALLHTGPAAIIAQKGTTH